MAKRTRMALIKKDALVVVVNVATAIHPDDLKFIKDKLLVGKHHLVHVDIDEVKELFAICDDLATFKKVVINNPAGGWTGNFILARLGFITGLSIMSPDIMFCKNFCEIHIPVYELSNTNDLVVVDLLRAV